MGQIQSSACFYKSGFIRFYKSVVATKTLWPMEPKIFTILNLYKKSLPALLPKRLLASFSSWPSALWSQIPFPLPSKNLGFLLKFVSCFLHSVALPHTQVLLTLPEQYRASYSHLSSNPLLMLEQLLMNMKVDWATMAVQTLHQLLAGQEIGFTMDEVDSLLSRYAGKALDFLYPLREKRSGNRQHPRWGFYMEKEIPCYILIFIFPLL